jgi:hypothetical protein
LLDPNGRHPLTFRIDRSLRDGVCVLVVSGKLTDAAVDELARVVELQPIQPVALDVAGVTLVDRPAVRLLAECQSTGIALLNCADYIREWLRAERGRT